jgi:hypothetical protein|tara:strand:- start:209 stop:505 length:297 start_codon:yes stop_codon:yes gene_type:complete
MEWLMAQAGLQATQYAAGGLVAMGLAWALKKIPNNKIKAKCGLLFYGAGVACTLGLAKWKLTKGLWQKTIEPYLIDAIDNIFVYGINEFIRGLRSDNK